MMPDSPKTVLQTDDGHSAMYEGDGLALMASMPPDITEQLGENNGIIEQFRGGNRHYPNF